MSERYQVVFDYCGYWVIDIIIEDGESCNVYGTFSLLEAKQKAKELNKRSKNENYS